MKETIIDMQHYNLHIIPTKKFKQIKIRAIFQKPIKKEDITIQNFLGDMLTYSTKKHNTFRKFSIAIQDLYSLDIFYNSSRTGNLFLSNFIMTFLNPKYTDESMYEESIKFLSDLLFYPNIKNNEFDKNSFQVIKNFTKEEIEGSKENKKVYATMRMLEEMNLNSPISYRTCGYLEDLEKITTKNLYTYYKKFMKENKIDIYVCGDIEINKTKEIFRKYFPFKETNKNSSNAYLNPSKSNIKENIVFEEDDTKQAKLSIGCYMKNLTNYERKYPLTLYNIILGSGTDSKFFKDIREKESLAYYIFSTCNKPDDTIIISSGINAKDYKKTVNLIKLKLEEMKQGNFSERDLAKAKKLFQTSLEEVVDRQYTLIDVFFAQTILDVDDIKTRIKKMNKVTKEEIIEVAKKIEIDTIYMLGGSHADNKN